jgi:hypothetical protein
MAILHQQNTFRIQVQEEAHSAIAAAFLDICDLVAQQSNDIDQAR